MKVKEIIRECLIKLGLEDFTQKTAFGEDERILFDRLLNALNIMQKEIASEYLPRLFEEEIFTQDGKIPLSALSKTLLYPVKIISDGVKRAFRTLPSGIVCDCKGKATLIYAYVPEDLTASDDFGDCRLSSGVLSDAVLGEYCLENKVFDMARFYDEKFRAAVSALRYKGRELKLKCGRWPL